MKKGHLSSVLACSLLICASASAKDVVITFGSTKGPDEQKVYQRLITEFQQLNPGIKVKIDQYAADFREKLLLEFASGKAPDAFETGLEDFPLYPKAGYLLNLDRYTSKNDLNDFSKQLIKSFSYKGHLYALTRDVAPLIFFYNKKLFQNAGVSFPDDSWNWDSYTTTLKRLTVDSNGDNKPEIFGYGGGPWENFVWQNGGDIFDDETNPKKIALSRPESLAGLQFAADLYQKYKVAPSVYGDMTRFATGKAATITTGYWERIYNLKATKQPWDVAPVPKGKQRVTTMYTAAYSVNAISKHPAEAYKWIAFICGPRGQREMAKMGVAVPSRLSIAKEVIPNNPPPENGVEFIKALEYGRLAYQYGFRNPWNEINTGLNDLWNGKVTASQAIAKIESKVNSMLGRIR